LPCLASVPPACALPCPAPPHPEALPCCRHTTSFCPVASQNSTVALHCRACVCASCPEEALSCCHHASCPSSLQGLRVCIMPLAELLGTELPQKVHLVFVLAVAFCLGVLVTYAEPAISAIRPLASLVSVRVWVCSWGTAGVGRRGGGWVVGSLVCQLETASKLPLELPPNHPTTQPPNHPATHPVTQPPTHNPSPAPTPQVDPLPLLPCCLAHPPSHLPTFPPSRPPTDFPCPLACPCPARRWTPRKPPTCITC